MAYYSLKAEFFVRPDGVAITKAPPLKRSEAREIYHRDGGVCQKCKKPVRFGGKSCTPFDAIRSGAVDHIFPRSRGGQNEKGNLRLLCMSCNAQKGAK